MTATDPPTPRDTGKPARAWYTKKRYLIPIIVLALFIWIGATGDDTETAALPAEPAAAAEPAPEPEPEPETQAERDARAEDRAEARAEREAEAEAEAEAERIAAAEEEAEAERIAAAEAAKFRKSDYADLTAREFAKVVRDPDAHRGEKILVFGEVFQFDSFTGTDAFMANVDGDRDPAEFGYVFYDHNALLVDNDAGFEDVVEDDHVAMWATVSGAYDYDTQIGGHTTAAMFTVEKIKVLGDTE